MLKLQQMWKNPLKDYEMYFSMPLKQRQTMAGAVFAFFVALAAQVAVALNASIYDLLRLVGVFGYALGLGGITALTILSATVRQYYKTLLVLVMVVYIILQFYFASISKLSSHPTNWTAIGFAALTLIALYINYILAHKVTRFIAKEKARVDAEIALAQRIQTRLLPTVDVRLNTPSGVVLEVYGSSTPATEVGGDFFDVVQLDSERIMLAIGDVSGHGVAAGVLMAMLKSAFRAELRHTHNPVELTLLLNQTILDNKDKGMFVSFQCALVDTCSMTLTLVNAGHLALLKRSGNGAIEDYRASGMALGLAAKQQFEKHCTAQTLAIQRGDAVLMFTDGITEARSANGQEFELSGVYSALLDAPPHARETVERLHRSALLFTKTSTNEGQFSDDATALALVIR